MVAKNSKEIILAINWNGVYGIDMAEKLLLELPYIKIQSVEAVKSIRDVTIGITIDTIDGNSFQFNCVNAPDIFDLITHFLGGLRSRSKLVTNMY